MPVAQSLGEARAQVERLVARFDRNLDVYRRAEHKETQVRVEFIDPFFEALDRQIDELVYELYGLTEEEVTVVEGAGHGQAGTAHEGR